MHNNDYISNRVVCLYIIDVGITLFTTREIIKKSGVIMVWASFFIEKIKEVL